MLSSALFWQIHSALLVQAKSYTFLADARDKDGERFEAFCGSTLEAIKENAHPAGYTLSTPPKMPLC